MTKASIGKKSAAKKPATKRKPAPQVTRAKSIAVVEGVEPLAKKAAKAPTKNTKTAAKPKAKTKPAAAVNNSRVTIMHGETRMTCDSREGADAIAALVPVVDAVAAGGRVLITSIAHSVTGITMHAVPAGHPTPYETNPGVVLAISGNNLLSFDHVAVGLATPKSIEEITLAVMTAVKPEEGEVAGPVGRCVDWLARAVTAAEETGRRLAAA